MFFPPHMTEYSYSDTPVPRTLMVAGSPAALYMATMQLFSSDSLSLATALSIFFLALSFQLTQVLSLSMIWSCFSFL